MNAQLLIFEEKGKYWANTTITGGIKYRMPKLLCYRRTHPTVSLNFTSPPSSSTSASPSPPPGASWTRWRSTRCLRRSSPLMKLVLSPTASSSSGWLVIILMLNNDEKTHTAYFLPNFSDLRLFCIKLSGCTVFI